MTDTPESVDAQYADALLSVAPSKRVEMACSMFGTAKALALAGLRAERDGIRNGERVALFLRFYGAEFPEGTRSSVVAHLDRAT
jgi:hypothetical protein